VGVGWGSVLRSVCDHENCVVGRKLSGERRGSLINVEQGIKLEGKESEEREGQEIDSIGQETGAQSGRNGGPLTSASKLDGGKEALETPAKSGFAGHFCGHGRRRLVGPWDWTDADRKIISGFF